MKSNVEPFRPVWPECLAIIAHSEQSFSHKVVALIIDHGDHPTCKALVSKTIRGREMVFQNIAGELSLRETLGFFGLWWKHTIKDWLKILEQNGSFRRFHLIRHRFPVEIVNYC